MEDMDKAVEIMKAAMEKEQNMNEANKSMDEKIDEQAQQVTDDLNESIADCEADVNITECEEYASEEVLEAEETAEDTSTSGTKQGKSGKSLFKNSKSKELAAKDQKIEELNDRLIRNIAEFDNFRKRTEKEKSQMFDIGAKSVVEKILPVIDNFERGLGAITEEEKGSGFAQGVEMIYKQLLTSLEEIGVKPIAAVGSEFDPNFHNAVMHGEDESLGENIISDEFQKGYMYRDMVVRHSMVKVVN